MNRKGREAGEDFDRTVQSQQESHAVMMQQRKLPSNGSMTQTRMLFDVRRLPCPELAGQVAHLVHSDNRNIEQMILAMTLIVQLAADGRLGKLKRRGTFLCYGPTGSGKSTLARSLPQIWATKAGTTATLACINAHSLASSEHGQSQKNVVRLFDSLAELCSDGTPVFAVVDEVETLATDRNEISGKTSPIDARNSVNAFLECLDRKPLNCFVLATTNVANLIDAAALNRFDFCFHVDSPDGATRLRALSAVISAINPHGPELQGTPRCALEQLIALTEGFSFRQVEALPLWCMVLHGLDSTLATDQLLATAQYLRKLPTFLKGDLP